MKIETRDARVLAGVRFVHAVSGVEISTPLRVSAPGVRWTRNRRSIYVVTDAPGLEGWTASFEPPAPPPALGSVPVALKVADPSGRFLARSARYVIPLDPKLLDPSDPASPFHVREFALFPSPKAATQPGWAVIRGFVPTARGSSDPLPGALIRVVRTLDDAVIGAGLSDDRGEVLVAIHGIPVTSFGTGSAAVLETDVAARLEVVADRTNRDDLGFPDPDDLEARSGSLRIRSTNVRLSSGSTKSMEI